MRARSQASAEAAGEEEPEEEPEDEGDGGAACLSVARFAAVTSSDAACLPARSSLDRSRKSAPR